MSAGLIRVYPAPGVRCSLPGRRGEFIGYERFPAGKEGAAFELPGGSAYVARAEAERVPNTLDVRRMHASGDVYSPDLDPSGDAEPQWFRDAKSAPQDDAGSAGSEG